MLRLFWDPGNDGWHLVAERGDTFGGASDVWDFVFREADKEEAVEAFRGIRDYEELELLARRAPDLWFERFSVPPRTLPEGF